MKREKSIEFAPHAKEKLKRLTKLQIQKKKLSKLLKTLKTLQQATLDEK
jgi:uncharacterized protein (DUF342 family)